MKGNVVEVGGLVAGTTAEDVAAIFKRCGEITNSKLVSSIGEVCIRLTFKTPTSALAAVQKFNNQPADGKVLSVRIVGSTTAGTTLGGRLGGPDGLGLVREEGSVDVLMDLDGDSGSFVFLPCAVKGFLLTLVARKMRSDSLLHADPRATVLLAPPGANPADYTPQEMNRNGSTRRSGGGRGGRGGRRNQRGGRADVRMDDD